MIPAQTIEEVRNRSDVVAIISEYVALKKRGRNYLGLCPFHSEKTASFTVSPEKQLFHCFGCGEGGNIIAFLMKIENISFVEAVAELGGKLGIRIETPASSGASKSDKERIHEVLNLANKFFVKCLAEAAGQPARNYLKQRGVRDETASVFSLGAAPDSWDELFKYLISRGASPQQIESAGLILPRESGDGYYDRFRNRLIFPVFDSRGRVIAFSGRSLDGKEPKYLNSPDTPVYRKGESMFGLFTTKDYIKKEKSVVLVEGNLDLVSAFQAGLTNVAAPLGTALTAAQCKLLARFTDTLLLAFDADSAGELAAERSAELINSLGLKAKIAVLTGGKDPDEIIQKAGEAVLKKMIASALPFLEFKLRQIAGRHKLAEIEGRAQALREITVVLRAVKDHFIQKEYCRLAADLLKVAPEAVESEIKRGSYYQGGGKDLRRTTEKPGISALEAEKYIIALASQGPADLAKVKAQLALEDFISADARAVASVLFNVDFGKTDNPAHFVLENLTDGPARNYLTRALVGEDLENHEQVLADSIGTIKKEQAKNRVKEMKARLVELEKAGETQKAAELLISLKSEIYQ